VNHGHVIECSLGYFLVPLANVCLGRFVLGEPLSVRQGWALVLAAAGWAFSVSCTVLTTIRSRCSRTIA
jgi:chloramphenicol-sensitive protein RarD